MQIKIFHKVSILAILIVVALLFPSTGFCEYYGKPSASPTMMHLAGSLKIQGSSAQPGDEIGFFDEVGNLTGAFLIEKSGMFGDVVISGDHKLTAEKEGPAEGEKIEIRVWQRGTGREYTQGQISISSPATGASVYAPYPGQILKFEKAKFYLIHIEAN